MKKLGLKGESSAENHVSIVLTKEQLEMLRRTVLIAVFTQMYVIKN